MRAAHLFTYCLTVSVVLNIIFVLTPYNNNLLYIPTHMLYSPFSQKLYVQIVQVLFVDFIYDACRSGLSLYGNDFYWLGTGTE